MKKIYNKLTTTDVPLDASLDVPPGPTSRLKTDKKPTIQAIGSKAKTKSATTKKASTTTTGKTTSSFSNKGEIRKKLAKDSIDTENLEKLNEESIRNYSFRTKRNQVIVVLLSVLLAVAIAFIVISAVVNNTENNCKLYVEGANATYFVDGEEMSEFRCPANLISDCILGFNVDLKINEEGSFNVKYIVKCYYDGKLLNNYDVYEPNTTEDGFTYKFDGYYHGKNPFKGNSTIKLCQGVALNEFDIDMDVDKFMLEIHTYIERANS